MAGVTLNVEIKDEELKKMFAELQGRLKNLKPVMLDIGNTIRDSVRENFEKKQSPDGKPWPKVSDSYAAWKRSKGKNPDNILRLNNILINSIHPTAYNDRVVVGTNVAYAAIHQFGGKIHKPERKAVARFKVDFESGVSRFASKKKANFEQDVTIKAHDVEMKPRPFLGVKEEDWREIRRAVEYYLLRK